MRPRFLPESDSDYGIPQTNNPGFTAGPATLLADVGRRMNVTPSETIGRVPTPFSRAFTFYLNLFATGLSASDTQDDTPLDHGRAELQKQARRTFRGICGLFALREVLDLKVRVVSKNINAGQDRFTRTLYQAMGGAPRGQQFWNPLRIITVQEGDTKPEVVAGSSPLTGFFPAAAPPRFLTGLYWYDAEAGVWYDPTERSMDAKGQHQLSDKAYRKVVALMKAWVLQALRVVDSGVLPNYGFAAIDVSLLVNEFRVWLDSMGPLPADENPIESEPLSAGVVSFLDNYVSASKEAILSDLPLHRGRVVLTKEQLIDPGTRLYGRAFGKQSFEHVAATMPETGENLGEELGLGSHVLPVPYVFVDQLFVKRFTPLADRPFSPEWKGLELYDSFDEKTLYSLLPFKPGILDLLTPEELRSSVKAEFDSEGGTSVNVTLRFGDATVYRTYQASTSAEYVYDPQTIPQNLFDARLFPDFAMSDQQLSEGHQYYLRARLSPSWPFQIAPFYRNLETGSHETFGQRAIVGEARESVGPDVFAAGQALFVEMEQQPVGLAVEGHGLVLLDLPPPSETPSTWELGIDFGTSNTCIAYRQSGGEPQTLALPTLTTTLLREPGYDPIFKGVGDDEVNEGASAVLDFFYSYREEEKFIADDFYFPTQIATRQKEYRPDLKWGFENGLVLFQNPSFSHRSVLEVIEGYPVTGVGVKTVQSPFRIKQDIKWTNQDWLEAFMRHLRVQVEMTAFSKNAKIDNVRFSYPKAFSQPQLDNFETVIEKVWEGYLEDVFTTSESEAVQKYLVSEAKEYIVFDVGGGTTDIIAFRDHVPVYQTSFRLAAGHINQYVVASPVFRTAFLKATEQVIGDKQFAKTIAGGLEETFVKSYGTEGYDENVVQAVWLGLLGYIEQIDPSGKTLGRILSQLRERTDAVPNEDAVRAVQGFFLSTAVLFGSLAFYGGFLMRASSLGRLNVEGFPVEALDLMLTGNGSKLYQALGKLGMPFDDAFQQLALAGLHTLEHPELTGDPAPALKLHEADLRMRGLYRLGGRIAPKVTVALGLITQNSLAESKTSKIPVANVVAEAGYSYAPDTQAAAETDLVELYHQLVQTGHRLELPQEAPPVLDRFLTAFEQALPYGNNKDFPVIPEIGGDWTDKLRTLYQRTRPTVRTRLMENAQEVGDLVRRQGRRNLPAFESLFVLEIAALLEGIREQYTKGS